MAQSNQDLRIGAYKRAKARLAKSGIGSEALDALRIVSVDFIRTIGKEIGGDAGRALIDYSAELSKIYRSRPFARANKAIGDRMRSDVLAEYEKQRSSASPGRRRATYLRPGRIGGDALAQALSRDDVIGVAGPRDILIADVDKLNTYAKYWRRLNYGTDSSEGQGYRMSTTGKKGAIALSGKFITGSMQIPNLKSNFQPVMPLGLWVNRSGKLVAWESKPRSSDRFIPTSKHDFIESKGNVAWLFLNVAYNTFEANAPSIYEDAIVEQIKRISRSSSSSSLKTKSGSLKGYVSSIL